MLRVEAVRINAATGETSGIQDYVAEEKPLHILINKKPYATIFCSPSNLKELAVGHMISEGIIRSAEEILEVRLRKERVCEIETIRTIQLDKRLKLARSLSRIIVSACGSPSPIQPSTRLPKIKSELTVEAEVILDCVKRLNLLAGTFRKTGGVHAAGIYTGSGHLTAFAEDVGRHNAVDKVVGTGALNSIDFGDCFLALTGRLTGDIVRKAVRVGMPVMASLGAPVDSGIAVAKDVGLTLIGFARGKRMNVYSFAERILS